MYDPRELRGRVHCCAIAESDNRTPGVVISRRHTVVPDDLQDLPVTDLEMVQQHAVVLNERPLSDRTRLVENRGPYMGVPAPEDWRGIHVPGIRACRRR